MAKRGRPKKVNIPIEDSIYNKLCFRREQCEQVINEIDSSPLWKIVMADLESQRQQLDNHWQDLLDEDKLKTARILKMSVLHTLGLKARYEEELVDVCDQIKALENQDTIIMKDYDNE